MIRKFVGWTAIWDLVQTKPFSRRREKSRHESFNVSDIMHVLGHRVANVNDDEFPVRLSAVDQREDTQHLDLFDFAGIRDGLGNVTCIDRVIVSFGVGVGVHVVRIFPGLESSVSTRTRRNESQFDANLR